MNSARSRRAKLPRTPWKARGIALLALAFAGACFVYDDSLLLEPSDDGSGAGNVGGSGGSVVPECVGPGDCPGEDTTCSTRSCDDGVCGVVTAPASTACSEQGGQVCDGFGSCVECVDQTQCLAPQLCNANSCVDPMSLPNGEPCTEDDACMSNQCADSVCCNSACAATCMACTVAGMVGTCSFADAGSDPHSDCGGDSCNGAGTCFCDDGASNGQESDVDCGGVCTGCAFGQACNGNSDCLSTNCAAGTCAPLCGDNNPQGAEQCDDGNVDAFDGCSATCLNETTHLVISEVVTAPTTAEMVEIYNPTGSTLSLSNVYLADYNSYYLITQGAGGPTAADFRVRFPAAASIAAGGFVTVSLDSAAGFVAAYGAAPNFDFDVADAAAPAMLGTFGGTSGLTNGDEMLVLFQWNGVSDLVTDLDYLTYGNSSDAMDKTGVNVGGTSYQSETPVNAQTSASAPGNAKSLHRCDTAEATETKTGGNGSAGHDETSESGTAFKYDSGATPSPGAPPVAGFCP
jgi:Lamin Tail Domain